MNDLLRLDIEVQDEEARAGLGRLVKGLASDEIRSGLGEEVKKFSQARILAGGPGPDGEPWIGLAPLTLKLKKGPGMLREGGSLMDSITWQLKGDDEVAIGSAMVYARIQHMGGIIRPKKGKYLVLPDGSRRTSVTIPARPYLGVTSAQKQLLERKVAMWIKGLVGG